MKKLLLCTLLLYSCTYLFGQEPPVNNLPDFSQASPQAFQFTKYGNVPVNESSGKVNVSIPLYTYNAGHLQLPIGLSYSANGLKVDQMTTWTGVQWVLQTGGVITREIRDLPDDQFYVERRFVTLTDLQNLDLSLHSEDSEYLTGLVGERYSSAYDTQVDIFTFSFLNYSGSFYFDENENPVLTNRSDNLKIEIDGGTLANLYTNKRIIITDPTGTKYYFGGTNATENSFIYNGHLGPSTGKLSMDGTTAYYLTKIEHLFGDEIYLEYDNIGVVDMIMQQSQSISKVGTFNYNSACVVDPSNLDASDGCGVGYTNVCPDLRTNPSNPIENPSKPPATAYDFSRNKTQGGKLISKITSNTNSLELLFNSSPTIVNAYVFKEKLDDFVVKNGNDIIFKAKFDYLFPQGTTDFDRFFLEKVTLNDQAALTKDKQAYTLSYKNPGSLPRRFSFAQDHLGYFNGKINNDTYIPKLENSPFLVNDGLADKNPDFSAAEYGTLTKVQYPTGGYTLFEYEADQKPAQSYKTINFYVNETDDLDLGGIYSGSIANNDLNGFEWFNTLPLPLGFVESELPEVVPLFNAPIGVYENQTASLEFTFPENVDPQDRQYVIFQMKDLTTGQVFQEISRNLCCSDSANFNLLAGHQYVFSLRYNNDIGTNMNMEAWAKLTYYDGYTYEDDLGIRIKRVTDYAKDGAPENIKRYYYKKAENINRVTDESKVTTFIPDFLYNTVITQPCSGGLACSLNHWLIINQSSLNQRNMTPSNDHPAIYEYVTVSYGGDNFENGGSQLKFDIVRDIEGTIFNEPSLAYKTEYYRDNLGVIGGKILEKLDFVKKDGNLFTTRKMVNEWNSSIVEYAPNMLGKKTYETCYAPRNTDNLLVVTTNTKSFKHEQTKQITTAYLEPLALDGDESTVAKVITTVDYEYGALAGLPIKTTTTNSDGLQQIVKNYYPYQVTDVNSLNLNPALTTDELTAINNLKAADEHRIGTPIQVETYQKEGANAEVLLSAQRNLYKVENGFTQLKGVYSSKRGDDFEERVVYTKYDTQGNPLELSKTDGTKVVYKWSTNHRKPLAMIVNASYAQVSGVTGNLRTELPNAQVTTYTYTGPLNLLSTVTDPRGYTTTYEYDELNRLKYVKDADGNILSANEYNYRQ